MTTLQRGFAPTSFGGQIHYATEGKGEVIVLIPQNPRSWRANRPLMRELSRSHRVIAIDLPGFGDSTPLKEPYRIEDFARCVKDLLDGLGLKKASIFGRHTGALVAGEMGAAYPSRVHCLFFSGYPFIMDEKERAELLKSARAPIGTPGGRAITVADASGSHLTKLWHRASTRLWEAKGTVPALTMSEDDITFVEDLMMDSLRTRRSVSASFEAAFSYNAQKRLPLIKAPTLLLWPKDSKYELGIAQRAPEAKPFIKGAKMIAIENEDVYTQYWRPKEMSEPMLKFLKDPKGFKG